MKSLMLVLALVAGLVIAPSAMAHGGRAFVTVAGVSNVSCVGGACFVQQPVVVPSSLAFFSAANPALFVSNPVAVVGGSNVVVRGGVFGGRRVVVNNGAANVVVGGRANVVVAGPQRVVVRRGFFR